MLPEFAQYLLFVGFAGLMFLLRLDAKRFSAAEWDTEDGEWRVWLTRISWYAAGLALALIVFALHPQPVSELNLNLAPDRGGAMILGLAYRRRRHRRRVRAGDRPQRPHQPSQPGAATPAASWPRSERRSSTSSCSVGSCWGCC